MAIVVELLPSAAQSTFPEVSDVVTAELPMLNGCPILGRLKAFSVYQGTIKTLEHVFRDGKGNALDVSRFLLPSADSLGSDSSASLSETAGSAVLRVKEWFELNHEARGKLWELPVESPDPSGGILRAVLLPAIVEYSGIYTMSWGLKNPDGTTAAVNESILSVERSLFPVNKNVLKLPWGPPTINELRMSIMDSSPHENFWLHNVEFSAEQILLALTKPIMQWNETPPDIGRITSRNFPFRHNWTMAAIGWLFHMAAQNYRRTRLPHSAGGVTVDDRNKEREYAEESKRLLEEYRDFVLTKKVELNAKAVYGHVGSTYGGYFGSEG